MPRAMVIGCGGAGKSVFSRRLGAVTGLPVIHLDRLFWKPGWEPAPMDDFLRAQQEVFKGERWIVDGHYGSTLDVRIEAAEVIIFLDMPTRTCLFGAVKRWLKYQLGEPRPDMTEGNAERLRPDYLRWILGYRKKQRPRVLHKLQAVAATKHVVVLSSRGAVRRFLSSVADMGLAWTCARFAPAW